MSSSDSDIEIIEEANEVVEEGKENIFFSLTFLYGSKMYQVLSCSSTFSSKIRVDLTMSRQKTGYGFFDHTFILLLIVFCFFLLSR